MDRMITKALAARPDYSSRFTARMEAIRRKVEGQIAAPVYLDSDMNYAVSQRISIFLDQRDRPVSKDDEARCVEVAILISSRSSVYTVVQLDKFSRNERKVVEVTAAADSLSNLERSVDEEGYSPIRGDVLNELAPGCTTEMDGAPATVFQALFSEMF